MMRWEVVKHLFLLNLLYINPQATAKKRKNANHYKQDFQKKIFYSYLWSQMFLIVILTFFFGFSNIELAANSFVLSSLILLVAGIFSMFPIFFSSFFEDQDTLKMLALPISEKELFIAKFFILFFQLSGLILSFLINIIMTTIRLSQHPLILSLLMIICFSLALLILTNLLAILGFSLLFKTPWYKKYRKSIQMVLTIISTAAIFAGLALFPNYIKQHAIPLKEYKGDWLLDTVRFPLSMPSFGKLGLLIGGIILVYLLLDKWVLKAYFIQLNQLHHAQKRIRKNSQSNEENKIMLGHFFNKLTWKSFFNNSVIIQNMVTPLFVLGTLSSITIEYRMHSYFQQTTTILPLALIVGFLFPIGMLGPASFSAIALSLDAKNFEYLKTLPIYLKRYLLSKLYIAVIAQILINSVYWLVLLIILSPSLFFAMSSYIAFVVAMIFYSCYLFYKDIKTPFLNWTNVNQLLLRGKSNAIVVFMLIVYFFVSILFILITVLFTVYVPHLWLGVSIVYSCLFFLVAYKIVRLLKIELEKYE